MQLEILPEALEELVAAVNWLNGERAGLGDELAELVDATARRLCHMPYLGSIIRSTAGVTEHRRTVLRPFRYCIIYRIRGDTLQVVAIMHTSRKPGYWAARL